MRRCRHILWIVKAQERLERLPCEGELAAAGGLRGSSKIPPLKYIFPL